MDNPGDLSGVAARMSREQREAAARVPGVGAERCCIGVPGSWGRACWVVVGGATGLCCMDFPVSWWGACVCVPHGCAGET